MHGFVTAVLNCFLSTCVLTEVMDDLYNYVNPKNGQHSPMISKDTNDLIQKHANVSSGFFCIIG